MKNFVMTIALMFAFGILGCAGSGSYGKFEPDNTAKKFFETYQVSPDYLYYFSGSDTYPVAILALSKSYQMGNDLWRPVQMTPESMKELVTNMQTQLMSCCYQHHFGFKVYDQKGKPIGLLYSYLGVGFSFQTDNNGVVRIAGPRDDDQLKAYQGRLGRR